MSAQETNNRPQRVAERVREELTSLLLSGAVRDPGAKGVYVSAVQMSPDLKLAKVFVIPDAAASPTAAPKEMLAALARASGFLRATLARRLALRYVPALRFYLDQPADRVERVERIFEEMHDVHPDPNT